jgi:transposase-like protein
MVLTKLKCPFCGSDQVGKFGHINGKQRYICNNRDCPHKTFYEKYKYNGCKPEIKRDIIKWSIDGAGIRAIARELAISTDTVISELKKKKTCLIM